MDAPADEDDDDDGELQYYEKSPTECSWQSWSSTAENVNAPYPEIHWESQGSSQRAGGMVKTDEISGTYG